MKRRLLGINALIIALIAVLMMFKWFDVVATNSDGPLLTRSFTGFAAYRAVGPALLTGSVALFMLAISRGFLRRVVAALATGVAVVNTKVIFAASSGTSTDVTANLMSAISGEATLNIAKSGLAIYPAIALAVLWSLISTALIFVGDGAQQPKSYNRSSPKTDGGIGAVGAWAALDAGVDPTDTDAHTAADVSFGDFGGGFGGDGGSSA